MFSRHAESAGRKHTVLLLDFISGAGYAKHAQPAKLWKQFRELVVQIIPCGRAVGLSVLIVEQT